MDKYPLLREQVEKIVVQHGRKGEAKSKDQVLILKCKLLGAMVDAVQSEIVAGGYSCICVLSRVITFCWAGHLAAW